VDGRDKPGHDDQRGRSPLARPVGIRCPLLMLDPTAAQCSA
jgi:hypothetical protein